MGSINLQNILTAAILVMLVIGLPVIIAYLRRIVRALEVHDEYVGEEYPRYESVLPPLALTGRDHAHQPKPVWEGGPPPELWFDPQVSTTENLYQLMREFLPPGTRFSDSMSNLSATTWFQHICGAIYKAYGITITELDAKAIWRLITAST